MNTLICRVTLFVNVCHILIKYNLKSYLLYLNQIHGVLSLCD